MSEGDLRREVAKGFGDFFERRGFSETAPSHRLFARLGIDSSEHARLDRQGLLEPLARDLMSYWDRLAALL